MTQIPPKTKFDLCLTMHIIRFSQNTTLIPGSVNTFWYKCFATNHEHRKVRNNAFMSQETVAQISKAGLSKQQIIAIMKQLVAMVLHNVKYCTLGSTYDSRYPIFIYVYIMHICMHKNDRFADVYEFGYIKQCVNYKLYGPCY